MDRLIPLYHLSTWPTIFILHRKQNLIKYTWSTNHLLKEMYILFYFMQYVPQHSLIKILFKIQTTVEFNTRCFWSVTKSSWINDDQTLLGNNCICFTRTSSTNTMQDFTSLFSQLHLLFGSHLTDPCIGLTKERLKVGMFLQSIT